MTDYPRNVPGVSVPTKMWLWEHEVEPQAMQQIRSMASLPHVHGIRVMPDAHFGKGAVVGSVIASKNAVIPSAVGVDIGCGVNAVKTSLTLEDVDGLLPRIRADIESAIPVGFNSHDYAVSGREILPAGASSLWSRFKDLHKDVQKLEDRATRQLGTLGGGNHFWEVCTDADARIWITLHSGSRNIGKELAERHIDIAKGLPENADIRDKDLSMFFKGTPEMQAYRHDLMWAQEYAMHSRTVMMSLGKRVLRNRFEGITFEDEINCHHNYVSEETIDGEEMIVTRKGAISAKKGELALIPGSMATGSYVVRGLGSPDSFQSASHGAGRRLSRGAAKRAFLGEDNGAAEIARQLGSIESRRDSGIVDELPDSYKDIHEVIAAQSDLVEVVQHLQTILCVKG